MALQADSQGFLVGSGVISEIKRSGDILSRIREDVHVIKNCMAGLNQRASGTPVHLIIYALF